MRGWSLITAIVLVVAGAVFQDALASGHGAVAS